MSNVLLIADNRKAKFDYSIIETYEAGLVLMGSEVKSIRAKQINLKDSFISFVGDEAFLQKAHIAEFKQSSYNNHTPERLRKILLKKEQLKRLNQALTEKGLTCVPLKFYFKNGIAKLEIALVKGKNALDKRASIKKRDASRQIEQGLRRSQKR